MVCCSIGVRSYPWKRSLIHRHQWLTSLTHRFTAVSSCIQPWKSDGPAGVPRSAARSLESPAVGAHGGNHHFSWGYQLFLWPFSRAMLNYQGVLIELISLGGKSSCSYSSVENMIHTIFFFTKKRELVQLRETTLAKHLSRSTCPVGPMAAPWSQCRGRKLLLPLAMYRWSDWANP